MPMNMFALLLIVLVGSSVAQGGRIQESRIELSDENLCTSCHLAVRIASDYMCDFEFMGWAVQKVDATLCQSLPADEKEQCEQMAMVLLPVAIEYARETATPSTVCASVCSSSVPAPPNMPNALFDDSAVCAQCSYVVDVVRAKASQQPAAVIAQQVCSTLPGQLEASCSNMVTNWGNLLQNVYQLDMACVLLGPCTRSALLAASDLAKSEGKQLFTMSHQFARALAPTKLSNAALAGPARELGDASSCDKCKMTVLEMRMVINSATVQQNIVNATRAMCSYFAPYEAQCHYAVDTYSPAMFQLIDKYFQPDPVCEDLHICPAKAMQEGVTLIRLQPAVQTRGFVASFLTGAQKLWASWMHPKA